MGLMSWLRGGRTTGEPARAPAPADARGADRGDRVDVSRIGPLQRTLAAQELVIGPSAFEGSLTTRQDASLGTPLGHLVSPDAPAGLVRGVVGAAPGSPAPPVRRAVEMPLRRESASAPVQRVHEGGGPPSLTSVGGSPDATGAPVRRLLAEQPPVRTVEETPAPEPDGPTAPDAVQRAVEPARAPRRAPGLGAPLPGLPPTAQRTVAASTAEEPAPGRTPGPEPSVTAPSGPPAADRREADAEEPGGAAEVFSPTGPELPEAADPVAPLLGDAPPVGSVAGHGDGPGAARGDRAAGGEGGGGADGGAGVPVQRSVRPSAQRPVRPSVLPPALSFPVPRAAEGPTVPLLGERGLSLQNAAVPDAPGAAVQRSSGSAAGPSGSDRAAAGPSSPAGGAAAWSPQPPPPDAVPLRWTTGASGPAAGGVGVPVQRAVSVPGGGGRVPGAPHPQPRTGLPASHGLAGPGGPGVQRQTGPPVPRSGAGPGPAPGASGTSPGAFPTAGTAAVAAGVAQRAADGSVVFSGAPTGGTSRPVVQRDAEITEAPPPPPAPPDPPADPPAPPGPDPGPASTPGPDAEGATEAGAGTPAVTDELVRALYTPLSRLLKADLRLERERAGFLIHTRH
ncbi:hypothetical protein [Streptomyces sp. NRRL WC-3549]|uniref:hypothetical protein n=1 Tax=Streptomyces sp. NRRL WC-3549 TaxID=1463925 RepID=UPI00055D159B|nr:hypothetical protein [Streptomyces sp. NRRL WC-3549]